LLLNFALDEDDDVGAVVDSLDECLELGWVLVHVGLVLKHEFPLAVSKLLEVLNLVLG
jgi:hypothetical protein